MGFVNLTTHFRRYCTPLAAAAKQAISLRNPTAIVSPQQDNVMDVVFAIQ